jgi:hypothetical protein
MLELKSKNIPVPYFRRLKLRGYGDGRTLQIFTIVA